MLKGIFFMLVNETKFDAETLENVSMLSARKSKIYVCISQCFFALLGVLIMVLYPENFYMQVWGIFMIIGAVVAFVYSMINWKKEFQKQLKVVAAKNEYVLKDWTFRYVIDENTNLMQIYTIENEEIIACLYFDMSRIVKVIDNGKYWIMYINAKQCQAIKKEGMKEGEAWELQLLFRSIALKNYTILK